MQKSICIVTTTFTCLRTFMYAALRKPRCSLHLELFQLVSLFVGDRCKSNRFSLNFSVLLKLMRTFSFIHKEKGPRFYSAQYSFFLLLRTTNPLLSENMPLSLVKSLYHYQFLLVNLISLSRRAGNMSHFKEITADVVS